MSRWVLALALLVGVLGCSTRSVVIQPEDVSKLNDPQWTVKSEPRPRPR